MQLKRAATAVAVVVVASLGVVGCMVAVR